MNFLYRLRIKAWRLIGFAELQRVGRLGHV